MKSIKSLDEAKEINASNLKKERIITMEKLNNDSQETRGDGGTSTNTNVSGTFEWAKYTVNFIDGCKHDCKYCYAKAGRVRRPEKTHGNWSDAIIQNHVLRKGFRKRDGTIMFPSTHDIHPDHLAESLDLLGRMLVPGNRVLIVSKPHKECIQAICERFGDYRGNILFRFTIGSANVETLRFWEPNAPDFSERLDCLRIAHEYGYQTSLSCEPMLDNDVERLVELVSPFITDSIWIGKANKLLTRLKINGVMDADTLEKANQLLEWQSDDNILTLYDRLKDNPQIKWKESIKKVVGIQLATESGLDI